MKKRALLLSHLLICTSFILPAQNFQIEIGPEDTESKHFLSPDILDFDETGFYVFQQQNPTINGGIVKIHRSADRVFMRKFDKDLAQGETVELDFRKEDQSENLLFPANIKGQLYLFSTHPNKKDRISNIKYRSINPLDFSLHAEGKILLSKSTETRRTKWTFSPDSSKLMFHYFLPESNKKIHRQFLAVFDHNLNKLWEKEIEFQYDKKFIYWTKRIVDNQGNAYILREVSPRSTSNKKLGEVKVKMVRIDANSGQLKESQLTHDEKNLLNFDLQFITPQHVVCAGMFQNLQDKSVGFCFLHINPSTLEIKKSQFIDVPKNQLKYLIFQAKNDKLKKNEPKENELGISSLDYDLHVVEKTGEVFLIAEKYYQTTAQTLNSNSKTPETRYNDITVYHRDHLFVFKLTQDGTFEKVGKILKRTFSANNNAFLSHRVWFSKNNIHFIFNDSEENLNNLSRERPKRQEVSPQYPKGQTITLASLNMDGTLSKKILTAPEKGRRFLFPLSSFQISPNEMVFFIQENKKYHMAKLTFTD